MRHSQIDRLKQLIARTIVNRSRLCRLGFHGYEWGTLYVTNKGNIYQVGTCTCGWKTCHYVGTVRTTPQPILKAGALLDDLRHRKKAAAALSALTLADHIAAVEASGTHVVVPIRPTPEMSDAGFELDTGGHSQQTLYDAAYAAMLAARPRDV